MKKILFTILACIPLLVFIGYSTWIIMYEVSITPSYFENEFSNYFGVSQSTTYNGTEQAPVQISGEAIDTSLISYQYKKETESEYTDGKPVFAGVYDVIVTIKDQGQCNVKYTINKKQIKLKITTVELNYFSGLTNNLSNSHMANIVPKIDEKIEFVDNKNQAVSTFLDRNKVEWAFTKANAAFTYSSMTNGTHTFSVNDTSSKIPGSTYKIDITLDEEVLDNHEFIGNNYIILKYKSAITNGIYYTIEDAILNQSGKITFMGDSTNANSYIETQFCALSLEQGYPYTNYTNETIDGVIYKTFNVTVPLYVPYNSSDTLTAQSTSSANLVYSALTICSGVNLKFSGGADVYICGMLNGTMPNNGLISHKGVIMNNGRITAESGTYIYSYGHLKGKGDVILKSGSRLIDIMRFYDWPGGSNASSLVSNGFPIIIWNIHSASCNVYIYKGAELYGFTAIEVSLLGYRTAEFCVIGGSSSTGTCLFRPTSSAISTDYILKKGTSENDSINTSIAESNQTLGQRDIIEIHGDYEDNTFKISLSGANFQSSTTKPAPFPFFDITICENSKLNISKSSYAFLAGTSLTVEKNAILNVGSGAYMAFDTYSNGTYGITPYFSGFCKNKNDALLIVNGTVEGTGAIGGKVITKDEGAVISCITKIDTIKIKDGAPGSASIITVATSPYYATGSIGNETGYTPNQKFADQTSTSFISTTLDDNKPVNEREYFFTTPDDVKTFYLYFHDPEEGNEEIGSSKIFVLKTDENGLYKYIITGGEFNTTKLHKDIDYWILSDGSLAKDKILYDGTKYDRENTNEINLYAVWKDHTYTFVYTSGYIDKDSNVVTDVTADTVFENILGTFTISDFINDNLVITTKASYENKIFKGWYIGIDDSIGVQISSISKTNLEKYINETGMDVIPLYCQFSEDTYTIVFSDNHPSLSFSNILVMQDDNLILPDTSTIDTNPDESQYCSSWYVGKEDTSKITLIDNDILTPAKLVQYDELDGKIDKIINIYGDWTDKEFTINYYNNNDEVEKKHYFNEYYRGEKQSVALYDASTDSDFNKPEENDTYGCIYTFDGWSVSSDRTSKDYEAGINLSPSGSINLYSHYLEQYFYEVTITASNATVKIDGVDVSNTKKRYEVSSPTETLSITYVVTTDANEKLSISDTSGNSYNGSPGGQASSYTLTLTGNKGSISATGTNSCITSGTLITMYDGTLKPVEDVTLDDVLLVYNHETGSYDFANIIFIENNGWKNYEVINLVFSNGQTTKIIYEHGFYDLDLDEYVYIDSNNYNDYIGHSFYLTEYNNGIYLDGNVTLIDAYITNEYIGCYSLVTVYHLNYFTDNLLSMPGGISGLFNIFEMNDDLTINQDQMIEDIEKYGLYTYEDFKDYVPYEVYAAFPAPYFKVAVGKGYITWEGILGLIDIYLSKMV
ncbi:MAG: hypothetical protein IKC22_02335 [Bacilli bacterium]|nr:hypothetical protein [Bacilli bacterium]